MLSNRTQTVRTRHSSIVFRHKTPRWFIFLALCFAWWEYNNLFLKGGVLESSGANSWHATKIACWILRSNSTDDILRSDAIRKGWGKYCDNLEFIDNNTPGINAGWIEKYEDLSAKSFYAWHFMFDKYVHKLAPSKRADFILKADTDTYILGQNMRIFLSHLDPGTAYYMGKELLDQRGLPFVAGTAIILSSATLKLFATAQQGNSSLCSYNQFRLLKQAEDVALAQCLRTLGVYPHATWDKTGAERFMVLSPDTMRLGGEDGELPYWYKQFSMNIKKGPGCCSAEAVAFHYVTVTELQRNLAFHNSTWTWD